MSVGFAFLHIISFEMVLVAGQTPCKLSEIAVQQNFDIKKFMGVWYEIEWISPTYNDGGDAWVNYYHVYREGEYGVVTGYYSGKDPKSEQCFFGGHALLKTETDPAKLTLYQEGRKVQNDYWILETDYTNYAVAYSCIERNSSHSDTCKTSRSWMWGRGTSLPADVITSTRTKFANLCMNMTNILVTDFVGDGSWTPHARFTTRFNAIVCIVCALVLAVQH
ncbi:hypothetical protein BaRGS_00001753 [Batillaria attramentaria]|uniref:Lipocalin/cytosolic fatty-acid binding domain-containing protein n=1 Tax=Batillaria attramentaria TaxID=370345 RepID=A0ABD0M5X7_9CAEN